MNLPESGELKLKFWCFIVKNQQIAKITDLTSQVNMAKSATRRSTNVFFDFAI